MAGKRISTDKFGNPYQLVGIKDKKENGFPYGYVELGGKLYKCEVSEAKKDGTDYWLKITKVSKRPSHSSM